MTSSWMKYPKDADVILEISFRKGGGGGGGGDTLEPTFAWLAASQIRPRLNTKTAFPDMGIPMLTMRRSQDRLMFNMGSLYW